MAKGFQPSSTAGRGKLVARGDDDAEPDDGEPGFIQLLGPLMDAFDDGMLVQPPVVDGVDETAVPPPLHIFGSSISTQGCHQGG